MASSGILSKQNPDVTFCLLGQRVPVSRMEVINALIVKNIVAQMLADDCDQRRRRHRDVLWRHSYRAYDRSDYI